MVCTAARFSNPTGCVREGVTKGQKWSQMDFRCIFLPLLVYIPGSGLKKCQEILFYLAESQNNGGWTSKWVILWLLYKSHKNPDLPCQSQELAGMPRKNDTNGTLCHFMPELSSVKGPGWEICHRVLTGPQFYGFLLDFAEIPGTCSHSWHWL